MNSLNKRYCASSFFVILIMFFVMGISFAKFHNANSCVTESSALLKNDICVVRMTKKVKVQKIAQSRLKEKKIEPQIAKEEPDVPETSEIGEENEAVDSGKISENVKSYKSYVLKRIAGKKTYPVSARRNGYEGKVKIHLVIDTDGKILSLEVCEPCEFEVLNNAAIRSVEKAAPFKKMNDSMTTLDFTFTLDFKLDHV